MPGHKSVRPPRLRGVPRQLSVLLRRIAGDFPILLDDNLVGIYLWGSLTYDAFDPGCSDVDAVVVIRRDLSRSEFTALARWLRQAWRTNPWARRLDMRLVINKEFLDKKSRCCGFYPYTGKLVRHGSDGNPIIWLNVGKCGVTLWGRDARSIAPAVSARRLSAALQLEMEYLREGLEKNRGKRSDEAFRYNAYAVLTACRILYTARYRTLVSKEKAYRWTRASLPRVWHPVLETTWGNRLRNQGATTSRLETDAVAFLRFARQRLFQSSRAA